MYKVVVDPGMALTIRDAVLRTLRYLQAHPWLLDDRTDADRHHEEARLGRRELDARQLDQRALEAL